jgi:hypothetical protein
MNEMRKLMEAVQLDEKASSEQWEIAINNLIAGGDKRCDGTECWAWVKNELHGMLDYQPDDIGEANQGGKTEHSGAKKGKGAYYGRKKEAKRDSNKNRRNAGKAQSKDITEVTTEDGTTYSLGTVEVTVFDNEISLKHGHGQNIFLSREEFSDFIRGIAHNRLGENLEEDFNARESTVALHELMDEGILDARTVADACLNYMSEAEVDDMASDNSFFGDE